jgi:hypothetical protein
MNLQLYFFFFDVDNNVVLLMTMCSLSICQYYRHPYCHTGHLHRFLLTRLVGMQQGYKRTVNPDSR